jgi:myo-inositol-1(or 4)-monophosphatase
MQSPQSVTNRKSEYAYLGRIESALLAACEVAKAQLSPGAESRCTEGRDIVTDADRQISRVLREQLLQPNEGWLSEEDPDDLARLSCNAVWVVDPIDGTREFVDGIAEWSISVGLVLNGVAIAGGVVNPSTGERFLGSLGTGMTYNGKPCRASDRTALDGATVLASRQEYLRGDWQKFEGQRFRIRPVGSIAYKLALVAAGLGDATWTLQPKHEWDIAAGVALVKAAGGRAACTQNAALSFNRDGSLLPGLIAGASGLWDRLTQLIV